MFFESCFARKRDSHFGPKCDSRSGSKRDSRFDRKRESRFDPKCESRFGHVFERPQGHLGVGAIICILSVLIKFAIGLFWAPDCLLRQTSWGQIRLRHWFAAEVSRKILWLRDT